jgi:hypothetical protein
MDLSQDKVDNIKYQPFQNVFTLKYQERLDSFNQILIIPNKSSVKVKRAYWNCKDVTSVNFDTYRVSDCNKQLSVESNEVTIFFKRAEKLDFFEMSDIKILYSVEGINFYTDTSLAIGMEEFIL